MLKKWRKLIDQKLGLDVSDSEDSYAFLNSSRNDCTIKNEPITEYVFEPVSSNSQRQTTFAKVKKHLDSMPNNHAPKEVRVDD